MEKQFNLSKVFDHASKINEAYHTLLKPLCKETGFAAARAGYSVVSGK